MRTAPETAVNEVVEWIPEVVEWTFFAYQGFPYGSIPPVSHVGMAIAFSV
jgi:hypothetical protein